VSEILHASAKQSEGATLARVEPQLTDLLGMVRQARFLPNWATRMSARQSGQYLSRLRGRGMDYDESRPYQPGDDIRHFDWRVTARSSRPHTKTFREERERPVFCCVDYRRSMFFATQGVFKAVQAARLAALLSWRAELNGDRLGGLVFGEQEHHEVRPRRGQAATARWLKQLVAMAPACRLADQSQQAATADTLTEAVARLTRLAKPGSLVFIISDFRGLDDTGQKQLARLGLHADVALIAVHDAFEAALPELSQRLTVVGEERWVSLPSVSRTERGAYSARFESRMARLKQFCRERRMLFGSITSTDEPLQSLQRLLSL
jgi:uncharacterized protein (DUF58 family)